MLGYRHYKKLVLLWRNRTRLRNEPIPEQIIMTYLRCRCEYGVNKERGIYLLSEEVQIGHDVPLAGTGNV